MIDALSLDRARAVLSCVSAGTLEEALRCFSTTWRPGFLEEVRAFMIEDYGASPERADSVVEAFLTLARARAH